MRKILLINPSPPSPNRRNEINLATLSIGNYLKKCFPDKSIDIIDFRFEKNNYQFSPQFKEAIASADAIGISCAFSELYLNSIKVARICRKTIPVVPIIVGGLHPTTIPQDFTKWPDLFDYIVFGYGEVAMARIINHLTKHKFQRPKKQEIINGEPLNQGEFFQIFDWTLLKKYFQQRENTPLMYLKFSSGCIGQCRFCWDSARFRHRFDFVSPKNAIKHLHDALEFLTSNGAQDITHYLDSNTEIFVGDEMFGLNYAWQQSFLTRLIEAREQFPLDEFYLNVAARIDTFREIDMPTFDKARVNVAFGIESFDEKMLELMKKTANPQEFLRKIDHIIVNPPYRLKNTYYTLLILFGFPGETINSINKTYSKLQEIVEKGENPNYIYAGEFALYPTTEVYLNQEAYINQFGTEFYFPFWWRESLPKVKQNIISPRRDFSVYDLDAFYFSKIPDLIAQSADKASQMITSPFFQTLKKSWITVMDKAEKLWELRTQLVEHKYPDGLGLIQREKSNYVREELSHNSA